MAQPQRLAMFAMAYRLRRPLAEIEAMPVTEFHEWLAFFSIMNTEGNGGA